MKLEFRTEEERNEFLIFNDLWVADGKVLTTRNQPVGRVEKSNAIDLSTGRDDLEGNESPSPLRWWQAA